MRTRKEIAADARALYDFLSSYAGAPVPADLILAAGSHDVRVAEHAASLYLHGFAPLIVCSGGFGKMTQELFQEPEAVVFARRCRELGVPEEALVLERRATNTGENFTFSRALLSDLKRFPQTGLVVCKPYMAIRAWATGTKQWPALRWRVCVPPLRFEEYLAPTDAAREISLMVGDLQRLTLYVEKGFQSPVSVPASIQAVYSRLAADGFDEFLL